MLLPKLREAIHKAWMYRTLTAICNDHNIAGQLAFKGGTAAAMLGYLDRFSIDLDFDYLGDSRELSGFRKKLETIFEELGMSIKDTSSKVPQYFLRYPITAARHGLRNTLKIDITFPPPINNTYETIRLVEIDRIMTCQTTETMFANKMVALLDRYEKNGSIAGRDIYDIHHFFLNNYSYNTEVILERRQIEYEKIFFKDLIKFIKTKVTQTIINQDLNTLLTNEHFQRIRKTIKQELLIILNNEYSMM